jgi:hypothetical protein
LIAFCVLFRYGLLDEISEEKLDLVDVIVFDADASKRVRQEALAFLMDHTEGFSIGEEDSGTGGAGGGEGKWDYIDDLADLSLAKRGATGSSSSSTSGKRKSSGASSSADQSKALARRQSVARQLETLTEFAEHHLAGHYEWSYMLADSCLALQQYSKLSFYLFFLPLFVVVINFHLPLFQFNQASCTIGLSLFPCCCGRVRS